MLLKDKNWGRKFFKKIKMSVFILFEDKSHIGVYLIILIDLSLNTISTCTHMLLNPVTTNSREVMPASLDLHFGYFITFNSTI